MGTFLENIAIAINAIRMNVLRAILTIFIIAFGIMALISMLTAVDGIKAALFSGFAQMGSNTFTVSNTDAMSAMRGRRFGETPNKPITYNEAVSFRNRFNKNAHVSISFTAATEAVLQYLDTKTSPKISIMGADHNYLATSGLALEEGRNFTAREVEYGQKVTLIGHKLKDEFFGPADGIGNVIKINGQNYVVIGYLEEKGSSFGGSQDNMAIIPLIAAQNNFASADINYDLAVQIEDVNNMQDMVNEATGLFRIIRLLKTGEDNNFFITLSESVTEVLLGQISVLKGFAFMIGIITLIGAAVGLTNIMLVTVTERTREIGLRKSLGATRRKIRMQFLLESIVVCIIGGILGIIAGIFLGNLVAQYFNGDFIIPWFWAIGGVILCVITGILAGLYPAVKASKLDPVEALRHE